MYMTAVRIVYGSGWGAGVCRERETMKTDPWAALGMTPWWDDTALGRPALARARTSVLSLAGTARRLLFGVGALVGLLQVDAGLVDCALGVVVGLDGLAILGDGAVALAGDVKDLS